MKKLLGPELHELVNKEQLMQYWIGGNSVDNQSVQGRLHLLGETKIWERMTVQDIRPDGKGGWVGLVKGLEEQDAVVYSHYNGIWLF